MTSNSNTGHAGVKHDRRLALRLPSPVRGDGQESQASALAPEVGVGRAVREAVALKYG